jgi:hypothetical protein
MQVLFDVAEGVANLGSGEYLYAVGSQVDLTDRIRVTSRLHPL